MEYVKEIIRYYKFENNEIVLKDDNYYIIENNRRNKVTTWKCMDCGMVNVVVIASVKSKKRCATCKSKHDVIIKKKYVDNLNWFDYINNNDRQKSLFKNLRFAHATGSRLSRLC